MGQRNEKQYTKQKKERKKNGKIEPQPLYQMKEKVLSRKTHFITQFNNSKHYGSHLPSNFRWLNKALVNIILSNTISNY